jgi:hypothetical protein
MAKTNKKLLLKLCIEGAQQAQSAKEKLDFIRLAMCLMGKHSPEQLDGISDDMKKLLGGV